MNSLKIDLELTPQQLIGEAIDIGIFKNNHFQMDS